MTTFLALFFMSGENPNPIPRYEIGKCYAAESEFRPNTILITGITNKTYKYKICIDVQKWSWELENNIRSIEFVYEKEVNCS